MIDKLAVIGVGLIGGSLALALKEAEEVGVVVGVGRDENNLQLAQSLGIIDEWTTSLTKAVQDADVVLVAVPMGAYKSVFSMIAPHLKEGAVVTDVGSTKQHAIEAAAEYLPVFENFVAGHPLAGTEKSGAGAAFAALYQNRTCIITPDPVTRVSAIDQVKKMWQVVGAKVLEMDASVHDDLLASVSHLPHFAAFALVNAVETQKTDNFDPFAFAAGGFRDFTRIASSSPMMWRDIAIANRQAVMKQIEIYQSELNNMKQALENEDGAALLAQFTSAKLARDEWLASREGEKS